MAFDNALETVGVTGSTAGTGAVSAGEAAAFSDPPPALARAESESDAGELLARMRHGDRDAASRFVLEFGEIIRRRVRGKLGREMRRLFDSQEILSTVGRRLDRYVRDGNVRANDAPQLWGLVFKMVDAALVDKVRAYRRLQGVEGEDSDFAQRALSRMRESEARSAEGAELELSAAFACLKSDLDREVLAMWLNDVPHDQIAAVLDANAEAVRKRWQMIRAHLRTHWLKEDRP